MVSIEPWLSNMTIQPKENSSQKEKDDNEFLRLVQSLHESLLDVLDYEEMERISSDSDALRIYLHKEIEKLLRKKKIVEDADGDKRLINSVLDEVLGFGPVEQLLRDETITDIFINGPDNIFIERKGKIEKATIRFLNGEHIYRLVQRVASKSGRHLELGTPYFDAQLVDGSRLHAIIPPIAIDGIKVSIRKFQFQKLFIDHLITVGSLTETMAKILQIAVRARFNIVICGGTGSGKTTLMNSLLDSIRPGERVITIEDVPELEPAYGHIVRLVTRMPNPEGKGAVTQAELMINALRMRPDRVILGEMRGAEAFNLLHAMNTGQDGSMVTLHASGTEEVISRLLNMILMARYSISVQSVRQQIAGALDLIIYVSRLVDGSRKVMAISQVSKGPDGDMKIYITVCHDRHVDDEITVHRTLPKAKKYIESWIKGYEDRYKWTREDCVLLESESNWVCTFESNVEDGPHARIELSQVK